MIGNPVDAHAAKRPERIQLDGQYMVLEPLSAETHGPALWNQIKDAEEKLWLYMGDGPFAGESQFIASLEGKSASEDPMFYALVDRSSDQALGYASLMRIDARNRVIEVGNIVFSPALQKTRGATESMYLLARYAFEDLGYRRYEWKCNSFNSPSRSAAKRFGFTYEGLFRQHMIIKGRNRDTAWFSMLDSEWPARKAEFERWLDPSNFDAEGLQKSTLRQATA